MRDLRAGWCQHMMLKLAEELPLAAPREEVWLLLRDAPRFAGLLPGVESVTPSAQDGTEVYSARVSDKIGPFKVNLNLEVHVTETAEPSVLRASLKGSDSLGMNRITGSMQVELSPASFASPGDTQGGSQARTQGPAQTSTQMHFEASIEVLGKLATLGAVPIRRRATQLFAEFARNIQGQFPAEHP